MKLLMFFTVFFWLISQALAIDVTPFNVGDKLNPGQAEAMQNRFKGRDIQPWREPSTEALNKHPNAKLIRYGIRVLSKTSSIIGPDVNNIDMRYSGNHLNCVNCHLAGSSGLPGTKKFGIPFVNVMNDYPNFRKRSMRIGSIEDRVNGCMLRSMGDGKAMSHNAKEMKGIRAYFSWLAEGSTKGAAMEYTKLPKIKLPKRKSNLVVGRSLYQKNCSSCHGVNGSGQQNDWATIKETGRYYEFPAIAGNDSFNDGAGMSRVIKATRFIYGNMPFGASFDAPLLTIEEAFDIAGYLESLTRPHKEGREHDFPNPNFRPKDYAVPAYFENKGDMMRAKYGPFH